MKSPNSGYFQGDLGKVNIGSDIVRRGVYPEVQNSENLDFAHRKQETDVTVEFVESGTVIIGIAIAVALDTPITREASNLQANVRRSVEALTGLEVEQVNIQVDRVFVKKEKKPAKIAEAKGSKP